MLPVCFGEPNESKWRIRKISLRVSPGWCSVLHQQGQSRALTPGWWTESPGLAPPCGPLTAHTSNSQWPMAAPRKNCKRSPAKSLKSLISDCFSHGWNLAGRQGMSYPGVALRSCKLQFCGLIEYRWIFTGDSWAHTWGWDSGRCPSWWHDGITVLVSKCLDEHFWRALLKILVIWSVLNTC